MIVGIPAEVKNLEYRVSTTPGGVLEYVLHGHQVIVERGAGAGSGFGDDEYIAAGATIVDTHREVFEQADLIMKVKEPIEEEYDLLRPGQILFTYLHLAADAPLANALRERNVQSIAYETVQLPNRALPLLTPMSEVAGRMSVQVGAHYLERTNGGGGMLLGGVPGVPPANVVVVGGGIVGTNAAKMAIGLGANVTIVDKSLDRLRYLDEVLHGRVQTVASTKATVTEAIRTADLVIGSVLIPGARAPKIVTREMVERMRAGSVLVDVAIDQGGCFETSHPTSHSAPIFEVAGTIHYCVTNMPGAVPRTSTIALSNVTLDYGLAVARHGLEAAIAADPALALGVNTMNGHVTHAGVAEALSMPYVPLESAMSSGVV